MNGRIQVRGREQCLVVSCSAAKAQTTTTSNPVTPASRHLRHKPATLISELLTTDLELLSGSRAMAPKVFGTQNLEASSCLE